MKVHELINELSYWDSDLEVHFSYNYGDHWRTIVAPAVTEVEVGKVTYSDYHQMDALVTDNEEDGEEEDDQESTPSTTVRSVVVLS